MNCSLLSIERIDADWMRVRVVREDGIEGSFEFYVDRSGPIELIMCKSFEDFVGPQQPGGDAIRKAVGAFDAAR